MVINVPPQIEAAINGEAQRLGAAPEALVLQALRERFPPKLPLEPRDEWERGLLEAARDCGVSLSDEAVSRDSIYD